MINVDEVEELLAKATGTQYGPDDRARPLPWTVWTSNSYRRVKTAHSASHDGGRDVLSATKHRDGCLDLSMPEDRLIALVEALNQYPALLSLLRHQQEEIEAIRSLLGKAHASASGPCNEGFRVSVYFHTPEAAQALHAALPLPGEG